MKKKAQSFLSICLVPGALCATILCTGTEARAKTDYHPVIDPAQFQAAIDNPYFPLVPGTTFEFTEKQGDVMSENEVIVTNETKVIMGVTCRVVRDTVKEKGIVKEDTFDWYAQDKQGNVWYFGEDTKEYHEGGKFSIEGSWEAGVDGALPGIVMPAKPMKGKPYRQEYYKDEAEDMAQVMSVDDSVKAPYGEFQHCVRTKDWSNLQSGTETKWYAEGIGFVRSEGPMGEVSELVSVARP